MVDILFYEKPGCINNTKQKKLLVQAGHRVTAYNLLTEPWTKASLRVFFEGLAVPDWFNKAAPQVKSGDIDPQSLSEEEALAAMLADPLLIRRPLMKAGPERRVGFDAQKIQDWVGLKALPSEDLESCPRTSTEKC